MVVSREVSNKMNSADGDNVVQIKAVGSFHCSMVRTFDMLKILFAVCEMLSFFYGKGTILSALLGFDVMGEIFRVSID